MPLGFLLFLLFLGVPLAEIAAFVVIGGKIGLFWTLAMVVITAIIGSALLRFQSYSVINRIRAEMDAGRLPGEQIGHAAMIFVAGILLLTPGFVTDAIGFLLFVPPVREAIWAFVRSRLKVTVVTAGQGRAGPRPDARSDPHTVELDADDYAETPNPDTPWRPEDRK
ncbi:FxsA family protein [Rhodobium gokarnense]|uniref:UPF0716 protein FxsA n=1 Tax=Rhodobium gokarnense TaxID=364296 RepID=A0ABT3HEH2_9HYPH|nr:FxsA family protein [Rhodobium gokarnense]MCW2308671.1 UPF0716 protein FxsA [Rhodobium gokarnense]